MRLGFLDVDFNGGCRRGRWRGTRSRSFADGYVLDGVLADSAQRRETCMLSMPGVMVMKRSWSVVPDLDAQGGGLGEAVEFMPP